MRRIITPDYRTLRGFTEKKTWHLFSAMPAAREINACCPTSLTLPKQPEDSADGFNGLLLSMFITVQICRINNNLKKKFRRCCNPTITINSCVWKKRELHTYCIHTLWQRLQSSVSRWSSLPCFDEFRKCYQHTADAEVIFFSQRLPLFSLPLFS